MLLLVRRWALLPLGSLTLIFTLSATLKNAAARDLHWLIVIMGLVADGLLWWLKPSAARVRALRLFAFAVPALLYALYFAVLLVTAGVDWPLTVWTGAVVIAGLVSWGLSHLLVPPRTPATPSCNE